MDNGFWSDFDLSTMLVKIGSAIVIALVTWIVARLVRWAIRKLVSRVGFLQRQGSDGRQLGESLGQVAGLLVWLFGLIALLQLFGLTQVVAPLQGMLTGVFTFLPHLLGAAFVFFIGYVFATIAKKLIVAGLGTINFGKANVPATTNIPAIVGNVVFGVIVFLVAIAALQALGLDAISGPAQQLLASILAALPAILGAAIVLGIGFAIAVFLGRLLRSILPGVGLDKAVRLAGIEASGEQLASVVSRIVEIAIMVFFGIMAAQLLGFAPITDALNTILGIAGHVLLGGAIIVAGFLIAGLIGKVVTQPLPSRVLRWVTIALFAAMGLKNMGLADSIVNLAFGSVVVGGALAAALAFGVGGREAAARALDRLEDKAAEVSKSGQ
ncbi:hypothetical protein GCM10022286_08590 [Gryllotalpicola daejeonensis]|uniref:Mechanosensitive ion channel n=1 Tax=Gryllotalpicola daejeonensis TaxID=993087 RepID=A0ABP7ZGZ3_9MICO